MHNEKNRRCIHNLRTMVSVQKFFKKLLFFVARNMTGSNERPATCSEISPQLCAILFDRWHFDSLTINSLSQWCKMNMFTFTFSAPLAPRPLGRWRLLTERKSSSATGRRTGSIGNRSLRRNTFIKVTIRNMQSDLFGTWAIRNSE